MNDKTTILMANENWDIIRDLLTAAEENWTPEDEGPGPEVFDALNWYIGECVKGHFSV